MSTLTPPSLRESALSGVGSPGAAPAVAARVLLVDDHPLVREGFARLISRQAGLEVCGEAAGAGEAVRLVRELSPDLVVLDVTLGSGSGIELCKQLAAMRPELKMLVVSAHDETFYAERALRAGARGYVNKAEPGERLVEAARAVLDGKVFLSAAMTHRVVSRTLGGERPAHSPVESLSDRELDVFERIGRGRTTQQVALDMHLSPKTVESYREGLKRKLGIANSNELVRTAVQWLLEKQ